MRHVRTMLLGSRHGFSGDRRELLQINEADALREKKQSNVLGLARAGGWHLDSETEAPAPPTPTPCWGRVSLVREAGAEAPRWEGLGEVEAGILREREERCG